MQCVGWSRVWRNNAVSVKRTSIYIYKQCKAVKAKQIELELLQVVAMVTCTNLIL